MSAEIPASFELIGCSDAESNDFLIENDDFCMSAGIPISFDLIDFNRINFNEMEGIMKMFELQTPLEELKESKQTETDDNLNVIRDGESICQMAIGPRGMQTVASQNEFTERNAGSTKKGTSVETHQSFECHECKRAYPSLINLKTHIKKWHSLSEHEIPDNVYDSSKNKVKSASDSNDDEESKEGLMDIEKELRSNLIPKKSIVCDKQEPSNNSTEAYQCKECNKTYKLSSMLRRHVKMYHKRNDMQGKPTTVLKCSFCNKTCPSDSALQLHELVHRNERPFKCLDCSAAFKRSEHLKKHKLIHSDVKPFKCLSCNREFRCKSNYNTHRMTKCGSAKKPSFKLNKMIPTINV